MGKYLLILSGVLLNATAQILLKQGMSTIGHFAFTAENALPIAYKAALNPHILAGLFCYVVSVVIWMLVLSRVEVSFAYPFLSVGYVVTAVAGYLLFQDNLGLERVAGIALICLGVVLVARS